MPRVAINPEWLTTFKWLYLSGDPTFTTNDLMGGVLTFAEGDESPLPAQLDRLLDGHRPQGASDRTGSMVRLCGLGRADPDACLRHDPGPRVGSENPDLHASLVSYIPSDGVPGHVMYFTVRGLDRSGDRAHHSTEWPNHRHAGSDRYSSRSHLRIGGRSLFPAAGISVADYRPLHSLSPGARVSSTARG